MANKMIVYVDGFNLYNGMHDAFEHRYLWLDLVGLMRAIRPESELIKVKYFTSSLLDEPDAQGRQSTYLGALKAHSPDHLEVVYGRYQRKEMECNKCRSAWTSYEEKETDVNIAVELVSDVASNAADDYFVVSGDSDLSPAIRRGMQMNANAYFMALFPPRRMSNELQGLMPNSFVIGRKKLADSQLPNTVWGRGGTKFKRPPKWIPGDWEV